MPPKNIGADNSMGRYIPTATASTGTRKLEPFFSCQISTRIIKTPINAPNITIFHGRFPLNTPSATDFIRVACGADSVGDPIVYAV